MTTSLPNGIEWVVTAFALARIGVVNVLANPRYRPAELDWLVENSGSALLIGGPGWDPEEWRAVGRHPGRRAGPCRPGGPGLDRRRPLHHLHLGHDRAAEGQHDAPRRGAAQRLQQR